MGCPDAYVPAAPEAVQSTSPGPITLVLFDLDGTLLDTEDLESFRGRQHLGRQGAEYVAQLRAAYERLEARYIYHPTHLIALSKEFPGVRFGIFTRSPRTYAQALLNLAFPDFRWSVVVAFDDVVRSKPYGDGITMAMEKLGIADPRQVVLVGDELVDVQAAYNAGCLSFFEAASSSRSAQYALEKLPDAIVRGHASLAHAIRDPKAALPSLERLLLDQGSNLTGLRVDTVQHPAGPGGTLDVLVMGRLFTENTDLGSRRCWHGLSKSILDNKSSDRFPRAWTLALEALLRHHLRKRPHLVVTVIPAKPGRHPRLEKLLLQLSQSVGADVKDRCQFVPDVLRYADGAIAHSGQRLSKAQRMANARANLSVRRANAVSGQDIIVVDDVVTSGATLLQARRCLHEAGAKEVTCVAFAKTVRFS